MPRVARVVVPELPHHVTQRGNNRQDVFFTDDDRWFYLETLKKHSNRFGVEILGFCLMTNHVHLIAKPAREDGLAKAVGRTHFLYSQYINRFHGRSGHLWQNRFFSCPLDERHYLSALRYVERNPVRARMVRLPWRYSWSSAAAHCGERDAIRMLDLRTWRRRLRSADWREKLKEPEDAHLVDEIRRRTFNGRPLGSDDFIAKLEAKLNRRLRPRPVGRPRKKTKKVVRNR